MRIHLLPCAAAGTFAAAAAFALASTLAAGSVLPPYDAGAAGAWQKMLKLTTTASVMHTTAHPDDEHGGMLALLSRRDGARVALLTLNRGEAGDNAIGPQLFDALGLIRTEELLASGKYYGVDEQYFTTAVDYGFSKRLDEALEKWGKDEVLRELVRLVRLSRPLVLVSRFQGNERDGHGNHRAMGLVTREAFRLAGEPDAFPEQLAGGLRPWQVRKLYVGGVREHETWTVRIDPGEYSPWLGDSYANVAAIGLSFQRTQNSGRVRTVQGSAPSYYGRTASTVTAPDKEQGFFDGIDTSLPALFTMLGLREPPGAVDALRAADAAVRHARAVFSITNPAASAPALAQGLAAVRSVLEQCASLPDAAHELAIKAEQFEEAISAAIGAELTSLAEPGASSEPAGPVARPGRVRSMTDVTPGRAFAVKTTFVHRGSGVELEAIGLRANAEIDTGPPTPPATPEVAPNVPVIVTHTPRVAPTAAPSNRPYFERRSIAEDRYQLLMPQYFGRAARPPALEAWARYHVGGVPVEIGTTVRRRAANPPFGDSLHELAVVPALSLTVSPRAVVVPVKSQTKRVAVRVDLLCNVDDARGQLTLDMPGTWSSDPTSVPFALARAGDRATFAFSVSIPALDDRPHRIEAVARATGEEYREGYEAVAPPDLEPRYLYRRAAVEVRGIDVNLVPDLKVGYVMGIGDQVPGAIGQLGYPVTLLGPDDLAAGDLSRFDTIVTGTRAYAVRADLRASNRRLLDYVERGGNLVVLYNTEEFVPGEFAPFGAAHGANAEEVSEEDSPVEILAPAAQALNWPNRIVAADFDGWVEQRGSKFWSRWDAAYTPLLATWDTGQPPQPGGWLQASYGRGTYTYFAYALHRQLPYGVPGAYRLLANLLALGRAP